MGEHKSGETDGRGGRTGKDTWIPEAHRSDPGLFDARRCPVHQPLRLNCSLLELCAKLENVQEEDVQPHRIAPARIFAFGLRGNRSDIKKPSPAETQRRLWSYREQGRKIWKVDLIVTDYQAPFFILLLLLLNYCRRSFDV